MGDPIFIEPPIEPPDWGTVIIDDLELGFPGPGVYAQIWERRIGQGGIALPRGSIAPLVWHPVGSPVRCQQPQGTSELSRIGSGSCKIPAAQAIALGVRPGHVVTCFIVDNNPYNSLAETRRIACFIVESRQYQGGWTSLSGPDLTAELQDYVALDTVGEETEVRLEITTGNKGQRIGTVREVYNEGDTEITVWYASDGTPELDDGGIYVDVDDEVQIPLAAGGYFVTTVRDIRDADGNDPKLVVILSGSIPETTKLTWEQELVYFYSYRIETTADADSLSPGDKISMYTSAPEPGGWSKHRTKVDKITEAPDTDLGAARRYIYMLDAPTASIPTDDPTDPGEPNEIVATTYTDPIDEDVELLFRKGTKGQWSVRRDLACTTGTLYEPNSETVWDALMGMIEMTGYQFKLVKNYTRPHLPDQREIRLLDASDPANLTTGTLLFVGSRSQKGDSVGVVEANSLKADDSQEIVTHVIPLGAGTGENRFTMAEAQPWPILQEYYEKTGRRYVMQWGDPYPYIRRDSEFDDATREVWRFQHFDHIRPVNESNVTNRREAANALLRAGIDYLERVREFNVAYEVTIQTYADPQPGDKLPVLNYVGPEPFPIRLENHVIARVRHYINEAGARLTDLLLIKNIINDRTGEELVARMATELNRIKRSVNTSSAGGSVSRYDRTVRRGDYVDGTVSGDYVLKAQGGNVRLSADDDVILSGDEVHAYGSTIAHGKLAARGGLTLNSDIGTEYTYTVEVINGRPRMVYETSPPTSSDAPRSDDPEFVGNIYP